jgi:hypothetical protein
LFEDAKWSQSMAEFPAEVHALKNSMKENK